MSFFHKQYNDNLVVFKLLRESPEINSKYTLTVQPCYCCIQPFKKMKIKNGQKQKHFFIFTL